MCDNDYDNDYIDMVHVQKSSRLPRDMSPGTEEITRGVFGLYESFKNNESYEASKCVSYSKIKYAYEDPDSLFKEKKQGKDEWLTFGTLVDLLVQPDVNIEDRILVNNIIPQEQFKNMSDYILDNNISVDFEKLSDYEINEIYEKSGSKVAWLIDTKRKKLIEGCSDYIKLLAENKDKIIVTTDLFNEATKVAGTLLSHRWTKDLFLNEKQQKAEQIELYYQYKIKYSFEGLQCKSMLDIIKVDHDVRLISPYDIKTGSDLPSTFVKDLIFKYRGCYQGCLYREGLEAFCSKIDLFKDYDIDVFRFVYVSRLRPEYPIILQISNELHKEIKTLGIGNSDYELPSLEEVFEAVDYYFKKVDLGEIPKEPFYLTGTYGERVLKATPLYYSTLGL